VTFGSGDDEKCPGKQKNAADNSDEQRVTRPPGKKNEDTAKKKP